jgi:pectate lyase
MILTQPSHGSLTGEGHIHTYTPDQDFSGFDSFTFGADDSSALSNIGVIALTVNAVAEANSAPVAEDQSLILNEGENVSLTLSGSDSDGDQLYYEVVTQPLNGSLSGSGANRIYTPDLGFSGTDSFTFRVNDGEFDSNTATVTLSLQATDVVKAFPGAVGFGANATGGRGGQVLKVTSLAADGPGSLQAALNQQGARIVVFEVSGVIRADEINIPYGNVTIAGQTAPGAGITIHGRLTCDYSTRPENIIVRHIRVRANHALSPWVSSFQYDALQCSRSNNLMFDHLSVSGAADENIDLFSATNITVQYSAISRPDSQNAHKGLINGPDGHNISVYKNFFAHNKNRTPAIANGSASVINNLVYNGREGFVHHNPASGEFNIIGNYYRQGPTNSLIPFFFDPENANPDVSYYLANNYIDDPGEYEGLVQNPWGLPYFSNIDWGGFDSSTKRTEQIHDFGDASIVATDPEVSAVEVLMHAGALPHDRMDKDNIEEFLSGTGSWGVRIPSNLMEGLVPETPPFDSDDDGMADSWEVNNGLTVGIDDSAVLMGNDYTAVDNYINLLADQIVSDI